MLNCPESLGEIATEAMWDGYGIAEELGGMAEVIFDLVFNADNPAEVALGILQFLDSVIGDTGVRDDERNLEDY